MTELDAVAAQVARKLIAAKQTIAVAEASSGGLICAALLAVPGASAYFLGGGIVYTVKARQALLGLTPADMPGMRGASEPYAALVAQRVRSNFEADWGLSETGAAGPTGNRYGDAAGHVCFAVDGPVSVVRTLETGSADRAANMQVFAAAALSLLDSVLGAQVSSRGNP